MNQSQWIKLVAVVVVVSFIGGAVGASLFSGGSGASGGRDIRIVDKKGALRIFLGMENMAAVMKMYGEDGKMCRLLMNADAIGAALEVYGQDGGPRVGMGIFRDGSGLARHDNGWRILWTAP